MSNNNVSRSALPENESLLTVPDYAERVGLPVTRVFDLLGEHKLICVHDNGVRKIPEAFLSVKGTTNKFVPGVIALLSDGGFTDEEIFHYLFTEDESLPGRPVDALHGHLAREVMRRAQAAAF
ncbi:Rv2175c family DNA-binding protein [Corynebacterium pseudotuberculosis]|uniref:Rv2175c family DNA-binding protein n=1 Tax=Corynebacterium pseudotuberculosis TaxID=1719 RepID=UPI0001DD4DCD|nr:Rv2175c family DNA-binding protein [Corynebacterium pseudotuberculosis]ALF57813.1 transcriptional regulator [Corynebacterium pseudotuberculosis]ALU17843.1 transcriptional regulator [Corynebacterium pseudotuberculosis]ALU19835.1 transcriptional regulator [Corynebacterium pseudotuberculosis]ALU21810.1 transcriptional regulator [Corynebacterium pseudotuberculosis]APX36410.1 DNA-binding protein [Corynebacterium pseudotuberculosis]